MFVVVSVVFFCCFCFSDVSVVISVVFVISVVLSFVFCFLLFLLFLFCMITE